MKRNILTFLLFIIITCSYTNAQEFLNAEDSNPNQMEWMKGFPPHKDSVLSVEDGSFFEFPAMRYSVNHMRQFMPTVSVEAATDNHHVLYTQIDDNIDSVSFTPWGSNKVMIWKESLPKNYTDGIIILHKGKVVYEKYDGGLGPDGIHAMMSVSKTLTGTLGAMLVAEGVLDENKMAQEYVPELKDAAFGNATIRQILDMTTGLQYSEDYADPNSEVWKFSSAGNPLPKPSGYEGPTNYFEYLQTVKSEGSHGEAFGYKTVNTDAMGWIISRVTGKSIPQLLSEKIWKPLGTYFDGYYQVDGTGIAFAGGGFSANLRDVALFGEMIRNEGYFNNQQILPASVLQDIKKGGNPAAFEKAGYTSLKGWSYRNMWWVTHNDHGAFAARGVHGQTIYVDPKAEMVIVRFASHPVAGNAANDPYSLPAYHAVAKYLLNR